MTNAYELLPFQKVDDIMPKHVRYYMILDNYTMILLIALLRKSVYN